MWKEVLGRFERQAPVSVMARVALEQALPANWIDEVFEAPPSAPVRTRTTDVQRGGTDVAGVRGPSPVAARGGAPDGGPAGVTGRAVREGQSHRCCGRWCKAALRV